MATATPRCPPSAAYPAEAVGRLFAPPETEVPADKLRRLLHEARDKGSFLHTAGAYDAFTSAIMTTLGFKALYGSGWQLAATKSMYPDIGIYQSHQMVELVLEMRKGIEGARNTRWYDSEGKELLDAPPAFVDMEAGFGGPTQTFTLATELIRVGAGGVHLENQDPSNRTCGHIVNVGKQKRNKVLVPRKDWLAKLKAIKAAGEATGSRRRDHRADRLDRRRAARPGAGRREDGDRGCLGGGRAGRGRDLARVQQHRARPAAGVRRGGAEVLPEPDARASTSRPRSTSERPRRPAR